MPYPWNKGLTKEQDPRVGHGSKPGWKMSEEARKHQSDIRIGKPIPQLQGKPPWNKGLTKQTDVRVLQNSGKLHKRVAGVPLYVYALLGESGEVRYVGVTKHGPEYRLSCHISEARAGHGCHKCNWLRSRGLDNPPKAQLLETTDEGQLERENYWIAHYRVAGHNLTNATDGGEGCWGYKPTEEVREDSRRRNTGKKQSAETLARKRAKLVDGHLSEEHKRKLSASLSGRKQSPEFVHKRVAALLEANKLRKERSGQ